MTKISTTPQLTPRSHEFADRLERLLHLPIDGAADPRPWREACNELSTWIYAHFSELPLRLPQYVMYYFHDPDICAQQPDYRTHQEEQLRGFIRQLRGEEPPDVRRHWWRFW